MLIADFCGRGPGNLRGVEKWAGFVEVGMGKARIFALGRWKRVSVIRGGREPAPLTEPSNSNAWRRSPACSKQACFTRASRCAADAFDIKPATCPHVAGAVRCKEPGRGRQAREWRTQPRTEKLGAVSGTRGAFWNVGRLRMLVK